MERVPDERLEYTDDALYLLDGKPFTGISCFVDRAGRLTGEHEYRDGVRAGWSRGWFGPGVPEYEEHFEHGLVHGARREWYRGGGLATDEAYEYGIRVRGRRWAEDGTLIEDFSLSEADPDHDTLVMYRAAYKRAGHDTE